MQKNQFVLANISQCISYHEAAINQKYFKKYFMLTRAEFMWSKIQ